MNSKSDPAMQNPAAQPESRSSALPFVRHPETHSPEVRGASDAPIHPRSNRILHFNERTGLLCCEAGVTIEELLNAFGLQGWFPIVHPETQSMTVGEAVAFDVSGYNQYRDGSFGRYVRRLSVALASGETVLCSREQHSDLFWATVGGMGLTGTLVEIELFLRPVETAYCKTLTLKTRDLLETLALFEKRTSYCQYAVAWVDCLASGDFLGRSLLTLGNDATVEELHRRQRVRPFALETHRQSVPFALPSGGWNRYAAGLWNELHYYRQRAPQTEAIFNFNSFFYANDASGHQRDGNSELIRYQCAIPTSVSREGLTCILKFLGSKGNAPASAVLQRVQKGEGWLSSPMPGYSLTMDVSLSAETGDLLAQLDRIVLEYGGCVKLTEDSRLHPAVLRRMYPNFDRWLQVKSLVDPDHHYPALSEGLHFPSVWGAMAA